MGCCLERFVQVEELVVHRKKRPPHHKDRHVVIEGTKYKAMGVIGEGAMSAVYKGRNKEGGIVAIKKSSIDVIDVGRARCAVEEAELLAKLQHKHVVQYLGHTVREDKGRVEVFLCLEFGEKNLLDYVNEHRRNNKVPPHKVLLTALLHVAEALQYLHTQSPPIAHRDVKAENVVLSRSGAWKLCDFGSATTGTTRCQTRHEINKAELDIESTTTPAYRAPEQCDLWAKTPLDTAVDVWAFGVLSFYIFYQSFPFATTLQTLNMRYCRPQGADDKPDIDEIIKVCLQPYEARVKISVVSRMCQDAGDLDL